jgi:Fur family peroxide stress response transcriptional regulator
MLNPSQSTSAHSQPSSNDTADRVRLALEAVGLRYTIQRAAIYRCLARLKSHPTVEEVYRRVRRRLPRISLATVYKALEALVVAGLATKLVGGDGSARYDATGHEHYHLRDTRTGQLRDLPTAFDPDLLNKLDPDMIQQLSRAGFQVSGYRLEVLGVFAPAAESSQPSGR